MTLGSVCVYCASSIGADPMYAEAAREVGAALARRGIRVVYGGGRVGLMGTSPMRPWWRADTSRSADAVDTLIAQFESWAPSPTPKWRGELS